MWCANNASIELRYATREEAEEEKKVETEALVRLEERGDGRDGGKVDPRCFEGVESTK